MRHGFIQFLIAISLYASGLCAHSALLSAGHIDTDEDILFYPTFGRLDDGGTTWTVELHACVFEPEANSPWRKAIVHELAEATGVDQLGTTQTLAFDRRLRLFLVDHERNQRIRLALAGCELAMNPTAANGHAYLHTKIPADRTSATRPIWITYHAILPHRQTRVIEGRIQLIPPTGVSVISDIDDTIKETGVLDRKRMIANTFWEPPTPVAEMAQLYGALADSGAAFHYVSGSPWQLYEPLSEFISAQGFPAGSMHLRDFRLKDGSVIAFLRNDISAYKKERIERILNLFPRRMFILVGDSGEKDPEIYGEIERKYPDRIKLILIRKIEGSDVSKGRFDRALNGVSKEKILIFSDPTECSRISP